MRISISSQRQRAEAGKTRRSICCFSWVCVVWARVSSVYRSWFKVGNA